jgi:hypothetical protein
MLLKSLRYSDIALVVIIATGGASMSFHKIGTSKYVVRIVRTEEERRNGWNTSGPFVVRSTSEVNAFRKVRRTWPAYVGKSPLESNGVVSTVKARPAIR